MLPNLNLKWFSHSCKWEKRFLKILDWADFVLDSLVLQSVDKNVEFQLLNFLLFKRLPGAGDTWSYSEERSSPCHLLATGSKAWPSVEQNVQLYT